MNALLYALASFALSVSAQQAVPAPTPVRHLAVPITRQPQDYRLVQSQAQAQLDALITSLKNQTRFNPSDVLAFIQQVRDLVADVEVHNRQNLGQWIEALKKAPAKGYDYDELKSRAVYTYQTRQEYIYGELLLLPVNEAYPHLGDSGPLPGFPVRPLITLETYCTQSVPASREMLQLVAEFDPTWVNSGPTICAKFEN